MEQTQVLPNFSLFRCDEARDVVRSYHDHSGENADAIRYISPALIADIADTTVCEPMLRHVTKQLRDGTIR